MKRILFLLKASREWGLGHVFRATHLLDELKNLSSEKISAFYQLTEPYEPAEKILISHGLRKWDESPPDVVVSDNGLDYDVLKKRFLLEGVPSVVLDGKGGDVLFRWGEYMPVRSVFFEKGARIRKKVTKVLMSFGGTDPSDFAFRFLKTLFEDEKSATVFREKGVEKVVFYVKDEDLLKKLFTYLSSWISETFAKKPHAKKPDFDVVVDSNTMTIPFHEFDFAFLSAGLTMLEASSSGLPFVVLPHNDRQEHNIERIVEEVSTYASLPADFLRAKIKANSVEEAFERFSQISFEDRRILSRSLRSWALSRRSLKDVALKVLELSESGS